MPTYEYACKKCGEHFDVVQSFTDEPIKKHKGCGGSVKKVFGAVGISFKGSGFYKNDSRSGGGSKTATKESDSSSSSSDSSSKSESKSQSESSSKPEKKSDSKKSETASSTSTTS